VPAHRLPDHPNVDYLRKKAKRLRRKVEAGESQALELVAEFHPQQPDVFKLADAQLVVARLYGFASWPKLVEHVDIVDRFSRSPHQVLPSSDPADELLRVVCLSYGADVPGWQHDADELLTTHPELATANVYTMAATGSAKALADALAAAPHLATEEGGPFRWQPLLYLTYSRWGGDAGWLDSAKALLAFGADPNAGFLWDGLTSPFTTLTGVFGGGESDQPPHPAGLGLARLLLEAGADPNDAQTLYNRGLGGSWQDDTEHLELLFEFGLGRGDGGVWKARLGPTLQSPTQLVRDELATAALRGGAGRARLLLENGADVDGIGGHPAFDGRTPYELALVNGHTEVADLLAAAGANARLDETETLIAAFMSGDNETVANSDMARLERLRSEHPELINHAAEHRNMAAVRLLASVGWDINHLERTTPLHNAAWNDDVEMARALIELGADPTIIDREHHSTPLGWADYGDKSAVAAYLRSLPG
jgi:ankyrin repeat protein